jgi:hypothetical protein
MEAAPARGLPLPSQRRELGAVGRVLLARWAVGEMAGRGDGGGGGQEGSEGLEVLVAVDRDYRSWSPSLAL